MANEETPDLTQEEQDIEFVRGKRKLIVSKLMSNDKIPEDRTEASILLAALDGLDRSAISRKRIASDNKNAQANGAVAKMISDMLMQVNNNRPVTIDENREIPVLGNDVPLPTILPGELDIGTRTISYSAIISSEEE